MKKFIALVSILTIIALSFVGCTSNTNPNKSENSSKDSDTSATVIAEGELKTGLAVISSIAKSKDAGDENGLAQVDSTIVAVTVDKDGKIINCFIDAAQTKMNFTAQGKLATDLATEFKTKVELADEYGMKKNSDIGKEWYEQAKALSSYVIGKTIDQVKGIAVNETGVPTDSELSASVTVSIGGYINAIEMAVASAKNLGAKSGDKLGLGVATNMEKSKDAGEKDGLAQAYSTYAAVTFGSDNKITSCAIDASQGNVDFSSAGKITSDLTAALKTKVELGDAYGMKEKSYIGKEWYEQANSFSEYVVGKTATDVKGIAIDAETKTTNEDLKTSVTVSIGDFMNIIEKASTNAK